MSSKLNTANASHVKGTGAYARRATPTVLLGAAIVDLALTGTLFFIFHRAFRLNSVPQLWWLPVLSGLHALLWAGFKSLRGRTLGDITWDLKSERTGITAQVRQSTRLETPNLLGGIFLTLVSVSVCAWTVNEAIFRQPLWAAAEYLEMDAYLPDMSSGEWQVLPLYYSLGAWPKTYDGKPVFYSLPYEVGPPTRFVGHIVARWESPGARVTFEGPKTPVAAGGEKNERTPRERIRACLIEGAHSWSCLKTREATLLRHLTEMQQSLSGTAGGSTALKMKWKLRWFTVKNAAISPSEQAQGIYLSATDGELAQERYVLVTENGTHQAIMLDYAIPGPADYATSPVTVAAQTARKTFEQAIRSLRASDELGPGRAWADRQLQGVRLPKTAPTSYDATFIAGIAEAQSNLIAKISVEPKVLNSYFHLAGTALLLNRYARSTASGGAGSVTGLELDAVARPLIQNAHRYALDISPNDPRTAQLQGFVLEVKKL